MYRQFNIQQSHVLPTHCIYVFCVDLRTNSDYFPIQHWLTGFYNTDLTLCSPVVTICTASLTFINPTFYPHTVFMCFVWIWEQTAIISLHIINCLVFTTDLIFAYKQPPNAHSIFIYLFKSSALDFLTLNSWAGNSCEHHFHTYSATSSGGWERNYSSHWKEQQQETTHGNENETECTEVARL